MTNKFILGPSFLLLVFLCAMPFALFVSCSDDENPSDDPYTPVKVNIKPVDMGLSVKWAPCNVGATTPESLGNCFAWGETVSKEACDWGNYSFGSSPADMVEYNDDDYKVVLDASDDAATVNWGGRWRMPTAREFEELISSSQVEWTDVNGVEGLRVKSIISGNSIFFPAAGNKEESGAEGECCVISYWTSELEESVDADAGCGKAKEFYFEKGSSLNRVASRTKVRERCYGLYVRPVWDENPYCVITYNSNNGSNETFQQRHNIYIQGVNLWKNRFETEGKAFMGWSFYEHNDSALFRGETVVTQDVTLYAHWEDIHGEENGHAWVNFGLPSGLKWATTNVGAETPEDFGSYFAWGETQEKEVYDWSTYKYGSDYVQLTKYNVYPSTGKEGFTDGKEILEKSDDAAAVNWGGKWRMPTSLEFLELLDEDLCTWVWTTRSGVNGYLVTCKINGASIFLPAAGERFESNDNLVNYRGRYWSSSLDYSAPDSGGCLWFMSDYSVCSTYPRYGGFSVRPVCQ